LGKVRQTINFDDMLVVFQLLEIAEVSKLLSDILHVDPANEVISEVTWAEWV